jgi:hypothetical protein
LQLNPSLRDAVPTAADFAVPMFVPVNVNPFQRAAEVHVEAFQSRSHLGAKNVDRGGHLPHGVDSR